MVTSALWSDANGDGWLDLLVTYEWAPIRVFYNRKGELRDVTEKTGLERLFGWWNGIAGRDVDGDGDIDYAVTNFGLNTKYEASPDRPILLHYGDFDNSGKYRIVEALYEGDTVYPVRGKSCSTNAMPFLAEKFGTFHKFARASLEEIYKPEVIESTLRFEAKYAGERYTG